MKFDKRFVIPGLIVVAALVWLYFHGKQPTLGTDTSEGHQPSDVPASNDSGQQYPSAGSVVPGIDPAPIEVGGSPLYLTYNTPPPYEGNAGLTGSNGCACETGCGDGPLVNQVKIPQGFFDSAASNLETFGQQVG